jgi:hypothetical protein
VHGFKEACTAREGGVHEASLRQFQDVIVWMESTPFKVSQ